MPNHAQLSTHLWLVLFKAYQALRAHDLRSIEATGLGMSDFTTLEVLLHKGPLPVNAIGEKIQLTSGSITAAVDRLERKGLVTRQLAASDRRQRIVHLTPAGRQLIETAFEKHQDALADGTAGLNAEEKRQLIALLKKLGKAATHLLEKNPENVSPQD